MDRKTYDLLVRAVTEGKKKCLGETMTVKDLLDLGWNSVRLRWANDNIPTALLYKDCDDEYCLDDETHNPLQEKALNVVVKVEDHYEEDTDGFPIVYCDEVVPKTESYYKNLLIRAKENNINIVNLNVADQLESELKNRMKENEGISDEQFDLACNLVRETYLKYENLTIWAIVEALLDIITDSEESFNSFDFYSITRKELGDEAPYYL